MKTEIDKKLISQLSKLPSNYWDFKEEDTKEFTHGIHNYPAMMVSPISRNIISMMKGLMPIESLFDPFAGSGTVLVEGMLAEVPHVYGSDINPLALLLTKAKTTPLNLVSLKGEVDELIIRINEKIASVSSIISTVDDFQGDERDVIIVSATASDPDYVLNEADFLLNLNRLNVAISRPRKKLVVIASRSVIDLLTSDLEIFENSILWKRLYYHYAPDLLYRSAINGTEVFVKGRHCKG